jgi:phospholipid/cholesterol/gamma-HCH transport system permease protein
MPAAAVRPVAALGARLHDAIGNFGRFVRFGAHAAGSLLRHPRQTLRWRELAPLLLEIGTASIPVVAITGLMVGLILSVEGYAQFEAIGAERRMGGIINANVVKQIGPVLAAVMVAGRVGGAIAAELGSMRISEQIDAMRSAGADPVARLVAPRVVACIVMTPVLTVYSDALGTLGAWAVLTQVQHVPSQEYWHHTSIFLTTLDPFTGLVKAACFGAVIGLVSCWKGFSCRPGPAGVAQAATSAFVTSFVAIVAVNLVLVEFLNSVTAWIYGGLPRVL